MPTGSLSQRWRTAAAHGVAREALTEYLHACERDGVAYRLTRDRLRRHGYHHHSQLCADDRPAPAYLDTAIVPTVTAEILPPPVQRTLEQVGPLLHAAITTSARIVADEPVARRFLAVDDKSEIAGLATQAGREAIADWMRVDYVLEIRNGAPVPRIVDINLMPGMTHTTHAVQQLFLTHLLPGDPTLRDDIAALRRYDIEPLDRLRGSYARTAGVDQVLFVVREGHGLEPDVQLAAASLTTRGAAHGVVVHAHRLAEYLTDHQEPVVAVRQARTVTKHPDPQRETAETAGIRALIGHTSTSAVAAYPGPHMYMENHAWPYFFQARPEFSTVLRRELGTAEFTLLTTTLADTGIIDDTGRILWPDGTREALTADALIDCVIKQGSSTGAEGVTILAGKSRGRRKYRQQAVDQALSNRRGGLVVQRYVDSAKHTHVAPTSTGAAMPVTGYMRYGAYYARGEYLGGYALLSADSRTVHGGSATHWVPILGAT